jgi:hypothetical protein
MLLPKVDTEIAPKISKWSKPIDMTFIGKLSKEHFLIISFFLQVRGTCRNLLILATSSCGF